MQRPKLFGTLSVRQILIIISAVFIRIPGTQSYTQGPTQRLWYHFTNKSQYHYMTPSYIRGCYTFWFFERLFNTGKINWESLQYQTFYRFHIISKMGQLCEHSNTPLQPCGPVTNSYGNFINPSIDATLALTLKVSLLLVLFEASDISYQCEQHKASDQ